MKFLFEFAKRAQIFQVGILFLLFSRVICNRFIQPIQLYLQLLWILLEADEEKKNQSISCIL